MRVSTITMALAITLALGGCKKDEAAAPAPGAPEAKKAESGGEDEGKAAPKDEGKAAPKDEAKAPATPALKAVQVVAGAGAACALMEDGTARCWGRNDYTELGIPKSNEDAATPVQVPGIADGAWITMGGDPGSASDLACVGRKDGAVWCWGHSRLFPSDVKDGAPKDVPELKGVKQVVPGGGTMYALMADGTVMGWGSAVFNALGDDDSSSRDKPMTTIPGVAGAVGVAAGQNHACALLGDGTVTCWGFVKTKQVATPVEGVTDAKAIFATSQSGETCVTHGDKSVTCWTEYAGPKKLEGITDVTAMSGRGHMCMLKADGTVWCKGDNQRGQIGNGTTGSAINKPTQVEGLAGAVSVAAGSQTSCAALGDGTVKCWGYNQRGQLGDGTLMDRSKPVTVVGLNEATLPPAKDGLAEVQEAAEPMSWDGMPEACKKGDLTMKLKRWPDTTLSVQSAYANSQAGGKTITVDIANYKLSPKGTWDAPRGKQFKVGLRFAKVDLQGEKKEPQIVDPGEFSLDTKGERYVMPGFGIKTGGVMFMSIGLDGVKAGTASITHLDDQWVCGELNLVAGEESITGPYAARMVSK